MSIKLFIVWRRSLDWSIISIVSPSLWTLIVTPLAMCVLILELFVGIKSFVSTKDYTLYAV